MSSAEETGKGAVRPDPPDDQAGVPLRGACLARSDQAVVRLEGAFGYDSGFVAHLLLWRRDGDANVPMPSLPLLGLGFVGGATPALTRICDFAVEPMLRRPILSGGSGRRYAAILWISPYPEDGLLLWHCAWPQEKISQTQQQTVFADRVQMARFATQVDAP